MKNLTTGLISEKLFTTRSLYFCRKELPPHDIDRTSTLLLIHIAPSGIPEKIQTGDIFSVRNLPVNHNQAGCRPR
jgi:hypothetical protein